MVILQFLNITHIPYSLIMLHLTFEDTFYSLLKHGSEYNLAWDTLFHPRNFIAPNNQDHTNTPPPHSLNQKETILYLC